MCWVMQFAVQPYNSSGSASTGPADRQTAWLAGWLVGWLQPVSAIARCNFSLSLLSQLHGTPKSVAESKRNGRVAADVTSSTG